MASVLREHQHELATPDESVRLLFGTEDTGYQTATRPVISGGEVTTQDAPRPGEDGRSFGIDYIDGKRYTFEINVLAARSSASPHRDNNDLLAEFEGVWSDDRFRHDPSFMAVLRTCEAGRTRRCYGRPREYGEAVGRLAELGHTPIVAAFDLIDDRWYDDVEQSVTMTMVPAPDGGLVEPLVEPLSSTLRAEATSRFTVGGTRPTWPVIKFHGPSTNPVVRIGDLRYALRMTIPWDEEIVLDTRPWKRTVLRTSDGAAFAGSVDASVTPPMAECKLRPGTYPTAYTALDPTATSTATVVWRNAHSRP